MPVSKDECSAAKDDSGGIGNSAESEPAARVQEFVVGTAGRLRGRRAMVVESRGLEGGI